MIFRNSCGAAALLIAGIAHSQEIPLSTIDSIETFAAERSNVNIRPRFESYDVIANIARFRNAENIDIVLSPFALNPAFEGRRNGLNQLLALQRDGVNDLSVTQHEVFDAFGQLGLQISRIDYRPDLARALEQQLGEDNRFADWILVGNDGQPVAWYDHSKGEVVVQHVTEPGEADDIQRIQAELYDGRALTTSPEAVCEPDCFLQTVQILVENEQRGSGVLIAPDLVLTAYHVVEIIGGVDVLEDQTLIVQGNKDTNAPVSFVKEIHDVGTYDLAVIELSSPVFELVGTQSVSATNLVTAPILSDQFPLKQLETTLFYAAGFGGGIRRSLEGITIEQLDVGERRYNKFKLETCNDCPQSEVSLSVIPNTMTQEQDLSCAVDSGSPAFLYTNDDRLAVAGILSKAQSELVGDRECAADITFVDLTDSVVAAELVAVLAKLRGDADLVANLFTSEAPKSSETLVVSSVNFDR